MQKEEENQKKQQDELQGRLVKQVISVMRREEQEKKQSDKEAMKKRLRELQEPYKTEANFAKQVQAPIGTVHRWISDGNSLPSVEYVFDICRAFDVSPNWLFGIDESLPLSSEAQNMLKQCGFSEQNFYEPFTHEEMMKVINEILSDSKFYISVRFVLDAMTNQEEYYKQFTSTFTTDLITRDKFRYALIEMAVSCFRDVINKIVDKGKETET